MNLVQQDFVDSIGYYIQSGRQALHVDTSEITRAEQGIKQAAEEISKPRAARITHLEERVAQLGQQITQLRNDGREKAVSPLIKLQDRLQGRLDSQRAEEEANRPDNTQAMEFVTWDINNGFSDAKVADRVPDKREDYVAKEITVHDNRGICAHAGRCTDGLKEVFRLRQEPFVLVTAALADQIATVIDTCPSGALSYSIDCVERRDGSGEPLVGYVPNGPYVVRGGAATLKNVPQGEGASTRRFTLCRCGHSTNKPFCSGAHCNHQFDEHARKPE